MQRPSKTKWTYQLHRDISVNTTGRILFSPSGKYIALGDEAGLVRIYSVAGQPIRLFDNSGGGAVTSLFWMGLEDKYLLSGHQNGMLAYVRGSR